MQSSCHRMSNNNLQTVWYLYLQFNCIIFLQYYKRKAPFKLGNQRIIIQPVLTTGRSTNILIKVFQQPNDSDMKLFTLLILPINMHTYICIYMCANTCTTCISIYVCVCGTSLVFVFVFACLWPTQSWQKNAATKIVYVPTMCECVCVYRWKLQWLLHTCRARQRDKEADRQRWRYREGDRESASQAKRSM